MQDSFQSRTTLAVGGRTYKIASLAALTKAGHDLARLPCSLKILLETLLRHEDGESVTKADVEALIGWQAKAEPSVEIAFRPARVLLQDFTGVPAVVDLAAMRDAMARLGGDPTKINPGQPVELVIDHSVQVDRFGSPDALEENARLEFERNQERYLFLRWGQQAFENFKVVPPDTGIVHQVNLEFLARGVMPKVDELAPGEVVDAYPDTVVGTDSHTTMINGLGVLGWGVGGIEAEAAMLGQPVSMLIPQVVGFKLTGKLSEGVTATDLVLRVTELLRKRNVVGKFVEFYGPGLTELPLADRATIANMAPEYGATCGIFPVDRITLDYMRFSGRPAAQVELVEAYMRHQGLLYDAQTPEAVFSDTLVLDLATVEPSLAGPKRPQDRLGLSGVAPSFATLLEATLAGLATREPSKVSVGRMVAEGGGQPGVAVAEPDSRRVSIDVEVGGRGSKVRHGSVVIAAITSCTNTSNPSVMLAAGLVAKKAVALGLTVPAHVKTSLAPGSKVVSEYLAHAGLTPHLETLGFHTVGYGCTTCIGNSGPLPDAVAKAVDEHGLVVASVLSGNRNFEGRVHAQVRANYLASPPLVVAYALAGRVDFDPKSEPLTHDAAGKPVYLKDVWPTQAEVRAAVASAVKSEMYEATYASVYEGDASWRSLAVPDGATYTWDTDSTYVQEPPYFEGLTMETTPFVEIEGARVLALLGDSVTTDHISPAGSIKESSPAGRYLKQHGVTKAEFNSYGSRRGNHEVMMRGTFANIRLRNRLVPGVEGGETVYLPDSEPMSIFDASERYRADGVPLVVIAGKEYGTGSSRDWAAKGPLLLGVRAVIAETFERIHRSNLVGMGIVPLQFADGVTAESMGLTGRERYSIPGLAAPITAGGKLPREVTVEAVDDSGVKKTFRARVRIDTPAEVQYVRHGGILQYVLRRLAKA
ncbi:MAG TPA: aconitate hydratase AcnA [Planctomycetota bacterium]|nr:aconitate hydratase AcnA [Planctomycetota bacterium]